MGGRSALGDAAESEASIAMRVKQRIGQRVRQLQLAATADGVPIADSDSAAAIDKPLQSAVASLDSSAPGPGRSALQELREDVLVTTAKILEQYLRKCADHTDKPMELVLAHRMLVKQSELQQLDRQRRQQSQQQQREADG